MCLNKFLKYFLSISVLSFTIGVKAYCQDLVITNDLYTAAGIPDSLKKDANSIIRFSSDEIKIKAPGKAYLKHHSLVTILNEKGDRAAILVLGYNRKYDNYSSIDVRVYDESGKAIKKYRRSDMYDGAASDNETLVSDDRFLGLRHVVSKYPETFEVSYEEELDSYITMPDWYIQERLEQSVQFSRIKVIADAAAGFKYECRNIKLAPKTNTESGMDTYEWQVSNRPAIKKEEQTMSWRLLPAIKFSTTSFNCFGYPGSMNSWKEFGDWIKGLNSDVCTLSDARVAEIKKMTDTIKTDRAKAAFLYKYMQQSMRYVGIQLGIGGFKPFPATFVDEKKYGDCKALSNYMRALLKAVNIPSHYALVRAGENGEPADFSFPHNDFNHIILCIPFKNDTTWLECTSNKTSFGKLGPFTENRNALLITDEGGKLVNTPKSSPDANRFNSEVHIALQPDGSAKTHVKILSTGEYRFIYLSSAAAKLDDQREFWLKDLGIKQPSVFDFELGKDNDDTKQIDLSLEYDKFCDVMTADKQFYRPLAFPLWHNTVPAAEKRNSDFYFDFPLQKSCITTIDLPAGYEVETMPANASLKFTYGNYDVSYVYNKDKNQVISTAKFVLNNQVIPATKYTEMQEYFDNIAKAQNKKLVIHKKA